MPVYAQSTAVRFPARDLAWAALTLIVGLGITGGLWHWSESASEASARERFAARTEQILDALVDRFATQEQALRGALGLLLASNEVTRAEWKRYICALELPRTSPGIRGIGYALWIPPAELTTIVEQIRRADLPNFTVKPPGQREVYTAILYIEPEDERTRTALGYDMWSEPVRRAAMSAARDRAEPVISGKVLLVQEVDQNVQPGFLMYLPHYATAEPPASVEARRTAVRGFVYCPFRTTDFLRGIDFGGLSDLRLEIFDGTAVAAAASMYDSRPGAADAPVWGLVETRVVPVSGSAWTLRFSAHGLAVWDPNATRGAIILGSGALISVLLSAMMLEWRRSQHAGALNTRLGRIVDESASEVYVFDGSGLQFLQVNRGARDNLGYSMAELAGLRLLDVAPSFTPATLEALLRPLRDGAEQQVRVETPIRRKDASTYEAEMTLQLSRATRPPVFIAVVQDITQRRRAEEHQRLIMDELNHRVKNTLAIVQSLAARTLQNSASPAEFTESFRGRLGALAVSHTLLTQTYWNGADLRALVLEHLAPFRAEGRSGVRADGPPLFLKPAAALALGLALHELATNAAKHGSLSAPTGRVDVAWRVLADGDHPVLRIDWAESGGPPPAANPQRGFGRTVIERGLSYELDGKVELTFDPMGLRCSIEIPLTPDVAVRGQDPSLTAAAQPSA